MFQRLAPFLQTLLLALPAGLIAEWLQAPLPWMIGPLLAVGLMRVRGADLSSPTGGRQAGQWVIGIALGLYFTPAVAAELGARAGLILLVSGCALPLGMLCAEFTRRRTGVDRATAYFASLPGGASEMAVLAERFGGAVDLIAAAHALRLLLVVIAVPLLLAVAGAHGSDLHVPHSQAFDTAGLPALLAVSLLGVAALRSLGVANAWILGPLFSVGLCTASGYSLTALPAWVVNAGQLLIGCALGCRFGPDFLRKSPRFLQTAVLSAMLAMTLGGALAAAIWCFAPVPLATLALAAAPGGIAEMSVTAEVLQLGVPLVTACHVLRVVVLTLGAQPLFRLASSARVPQTG